LRLALLMTARAGRPSLGKAAATLGFIINMTCSL
jgi:hypothetical protein